MRYVLPLVLVVSACNGHGDDTSAHDTGAPCAPSVTPAVASLRADGEDHATVAVEACGKGVTLATSLGTLSSDPSGWTLTAGNVPGDAVLTLMDGEEPLATATVAFDGGVPVSAQLHQHGPLSEGDTTHEYQTLQAERWGIDQIWWADHDYRYWYDWFHTPEWQFGVPLQTADPGDGKRAAWWEISGTPSASFDVDLDEAEALDGQPSMHLAETDLQTDRLIRWSSVSWYSIGRRTYRPLLADVTVTFSIEPSADWDSQKNAVRVSLPLSQVDQGVSPTLVFVAADDKGKIGADDYPVYIPALVPGEWNLVTLDVSQWADEHLPEGRDATILGLTISVGAGSGTTADVHFGGLHVVEALSGDDLRAAQRNLLDERYSGTVRHVVGQELTYDTTDTLHLVALGEQLPWIDYGVMSLKDDAAEIVSTVQDEGGAVVYGHPFGVTLGLDDVADPDRMVSDTCDKLVLNDVYGADAIEIGYPERVLPLDNHLALWDCLLRRGVLATSVASSDQHVTRTWDTYTNRYVTWLVTFDDSVDGMIDALRRGRAFWGDPTLFADPHAVRLDLDVPNVAVMGQVAQVQGTQTVEARVAGLNDGDQVVFTVDGFESDPVTPVDGVASIEVDPHAWTVVRAEVRRADGTRELWTNPIVLTTAMPSTVPSIRVARP